MLNDKARDKILEKFDGDFQTLFVLASALDLLSHHVKMNKETIIKHYGEVTIKSIEILNKREK